MGIAAGRLTSNMLTMLCLQQAHIASLETTDENRAALLVGLDYLLKISFVEDDEVFKICLDYWNYFVPDVYSRCALMPSKSPCHCNKEGHEGRTKVQCD